MNLDHLKVFLCILEKGSLAAAGRELGLSATTMSERLGALEERYGVTLLHRTTRALCLTEEGRLLAEGARYLLAEAQDLESQLLSGAQTLSGLIRVSAAFDLGQSTVEPVINAFLAAHPQITIDLVLSDGYVNLLDEGIDMAVRFGNLADSTLLARTVGHSQRIFCASPAYLARQGIPQTPEELADHNCLLMRFGAELDHLWQICRQGQDHHIAVTGNRITNDGRLVRDWCLAGYGIACKSFWDVQEDLETGALVQLLQEYTPLPKAIQILFPPSRRQPLRVKAFAEALAKRFLF